MAANWFSDLEMDDPSFFHQWKADSLDQITDQEIAAALGQEFQQSFSSESHTSYPSYHPITGNICMERPKKVLKASSWDSCITEQNSAAVADASSPSILSFGKLEGPKNQLDLYGGAVSMREEMEISFPNGAKRKYEMMVGQGVKKTRPNPQNQDHIIAERKRREKLSQRFIALSAIVPGLKKMDKASVLGDAIKYLKQLQEKVQALEDQAVKRTVESAVIVEKSQLSHDHDDSPSSDDNSDGCRPGGRLPEIEVKMSQKSALIKIHCENHKGILVKALLEIEKLHLTVINTSVISFAGSSLDITVMAQVEEEFSMSAKDFVKKLNSAFKQFM
ncbi:transcription factor bHLH18-like [Typha latifolia]|uniref:transcription factor bHLH18-like n=1 Tax=Typha latifolia TaxID=4733 RepID=UPI003C2E9930